MAASGNLASQIAAYEAMLRRRAGERVASGGDATLRALHEAISDWRRQRASSGAAGVVRTAVPAPPAGPAGEAGPATPDEAGGTRILSVEPYGPTVRVFRISRPPGLAFRPGQYIKVGAPGGGTEKFSIASAPDDPHLELAIELRPGGTVTPALFALGAGDPIQVGADAGGSLRRDPAARHHLMVATVTGLAPLRSMLLDALHQGTTARFTILQGASLAAELCFHDELVALAAVDARVAYVPTVSQPGDPTNRSWTGAVGRVDALVPSVARGLDPSTTRAYAVGHAGMIDVVRDHLGRAGFAVSTESYGR
jgi:NAD(P)H-flavin reductase